MRRTRRGLQELAKNKRIFRSEGRGREKEGRRRRITRRGRNRMGKRRS